MGTTACPQVKCGGGQNYENVDPYSFPTATFEEFKENIEISILQHGVDDKYA